MIERIKNLFSTVDITPNNCLEQNILLLTHSPSAPTSGYHSTFVTFEKCTCDIVFDINHAITLLNTKRYNMIISPKKLINQLNALAMRRLEQYFAFKQIPILTLEEHKNSRGAND